MTRSNHPNTEIPARFVAGGFLWLALLALVLPGAAFAQAWTAKANLPTARQKLATCVIGDHIYAIGGTTAANQPGLSTNERYDTQTDTWAARAPMPTPRRELTASVVDGKCYVIGGTAGIITPLSVLEIYDPATDQWSSGADMPTARFYPVSAAIDGIIYVAGGAAGINTVYNHLQAYDPATDSWSHLAPMPTPRAVSGAAGLNGRLYVVGGTNDPFSQRFAVVEYYDPVTDQWSAAANLPAALGALSAEAAGGRLFTVGGSGPNQAGVASVYAYDPAADSWTAATPLPLTRAVHATAVANGELFVFGGALSTQLPHPALSDVLALPVPADEPAVPINAGMADAWFDPATSGQGFFIAVFPGIEIVFLSWFTFDTERPDPAIQADLGEPGHRWLTAQGPYAGGVAVLDVAMTSGGVFDSPEPATASDPDYGTITIEWQDCESATLDYDLTVPDVQGSIDLQRVVSDRVSLCEALAAD